MKSWNITFKAMLPFNFCFSPAVISPPNGQPVPTFYAPLPFLKDFIYFIFKEGERRRNMDVWEIHRLVASLVPPTGDLAHNPGMCLHRKTNPQTFGPQAATQSPELHQPGHIALFFFTVIFIVDAIRVFPAFSPLPNLYPAPPCLGTFKSHFSFY